MTDHVKPEPTMLTMAIAAKRLGKHPETIRRWCRLGLLPHCVMPSGQHMIPAAVIENLLTASTTPQRNPNTP